MESKALKEFSNFGFMINQLRKHANRFPEKDVFIYLENGENIERKVTFSELLRYVENLGSQLYSKELESKRALLIYQDTIEFSISFLACQYAGVVAVPIYFAKGARQITKIENIIGDAEVSVILTTSNLQTPVQEMLSSCNPDIPRIQTLTTDTARLAACPFILKTPSDFSIAFIQYTSGSTGAPKGVMISKENLVANQEVIIKAFGCTESSVLFSWLPFQHDMGLIGNILHAVYVGFSCVLMSPFHFMQKPQRWLEAISKYRVTHSGAPNFAYDLCVSKVQVDQMLGIDLSSWRLAYNGSEPIRYSTLQRFSNQFAKAGFSINAFFPCYGLAEATLMVSGYKKFSPPVTLFVDKELMLKGKISLLADFDNRATPMVSSSAIPAGVVVKILDIRTGKTCKDLEQGEICVAGQSVTSGYWNKNNENDFIKVEGCEFFRTGDLGFLYENELFISGRLKELLIIRGQNYYPQDIEQAVAECDPAIEQNGVSVFSIANEKEDFVIVAEVKRTMVKNLAAKNTIRAIEQTVLGAFGIEPVDIVLTMPLAIPRTTSGKLQRLKCNELYMQKKFAAIASKSHLLLAEPAGENEMIIAEVISKANANEIRAYLIMILRAKKIMIDDSRGEDIELTTLGLDSLRIMEIVNVVGKDLGIQLDAAVVFHENSLNALVNTIESMLWIKNAKVSGEQILL